MNAGVSGATSVDSRQQIGWIMRQPVAVLVLETGANDGLRGLPPERMRENIDAIVARARAQRPPPRIVLLGMEAPPNLGADYTRRFRDVYRDVARTEKISAFLPFLLQGVAGVDTLNQADRVHPTAAGQRIIADSVWRVLAPLLAR